MICPAHDGKQEYIRCLACGGVSRAQDLQPAMRGLCTFVACAGACLAVVGLLFAIDPGIGIIGSSVMGILWFVVWATFCEPYRDIDLDRCRPIMLAWKEAKRRERTQTDGKSS